ncbi:MAG TPA: S8 family serine peptidase [Candidatus Limnocylindrales bacterium]|nr:S8 family serine peptidase [Candidatus Limnocylindrales bacterium]
MSSLRTRVAVAVVAALLLPGAALGAMPTVTITSVGGQPVVDGEVARPVSGSVAVEGTASLNGATTQPVVKPLVADAGGSPFIAAGGTGTLLGAGYGGSEPYTFVWSSPVGTIQGADAPTAQLDTTGVAPGTYTISLTVTDAAGRSASDTVKARVYETESAVLLDQTKSDTTPGTFAAMTSVEFPFVVPAGTQQIDVRLSWGIPANDYDMRLLDPHGVERDDNGNPAGEPETGGYANPEPGTWKLMADRWATVADSVRGQATGLVATGGDPRPAVDAGGPYRFSLTDSQVLTGSVTGGSTPLTVGWDTDMDGRIDAPGATATVQLAAGRHLVTLRATDAAGFERLETTSVLVADAARLAAETTPVTVIGIADSGINPYHLEFSAETYPDPDVLALTENFTRHPSEYIPGYPADSEAIQLTFGQGYAPAADAAIWAGDHSRIKLNKMYWFPGTKIIGAWDAGDVKPLNAAADSHPILDDDGHGTGSSSVSTGNRYGYCPSCLLMFVESLDETVNAKLPWVDITSNSFGPAAGAPVGLALQVLLQDPGEQTRAAAERGQTTLFAAGNGLGNAFDVPQMAYGNETTGSDWIITVGAIRRDNQRAIVGDAIPVHISSWGDGNLPSACRTGTVGQCAFGGTSAASPYTAGVFGHVLTEVRRAIGDGQAGQKPGQVVAEGLAIAASEALADGKLTRAELRDAVLRTAIPLNQQNRSTMFPYPLTAPYSGDPNVLFEGYGAATPESARRAIDVLLGRAPTPERPFEDSFFAVDRVIRDTIYGGFDRDGDGQRDSHAVAGLSMTFEQLSSVQGTLYALRTAAEKSGAMDAYALQPLGANPLTYFLHRVVSRESDSAVTEACDVEGNELSMDTSDTAGDVEPCFEARLTSVPAAYRPLAMWASKGTLDGPLPAGSTVNVRLWITTENPTVLRPTGVLVATDREIGSGEGALQPVLGSGPGPGSNVQGVAIPDAGGCETLGEACWTSFQWSFQTTRPAFTGEQLAFQVQLVGTRAWSFGYEGAHASRIEIQPAPLPPSGLEFGVTIDSPANGSESVEGQGAVAGGRFAFPDLGSDPTGAGDHPTTRRVEVSVDDASFAAPIEASLDQATGTWSAPIGELARGSHTVYARATINGSTRSAVAESTFRVVSAAHIEWQVVRKNAAPDPARWQRASGVEEWRFAFDTAAYKKGAATILVRLVQGDLELARTSARVKLQ